MAGYTSTATQYGEYIQSHNIDMITKSLSYKESRYEAADAQIRQKINEIGALDILKDEDKSYLLSRLNSMVGNVNNVGALDLSDAGIVKNLDSHIQQSIDDNVLNAYQSTKQIRAFQESLQEIQKKQKDLFNPLNVAYAMQPVQKYLASDKVGENVSDYGALIYTPYTDIEGEISKEMDNYVKNMKDGKIQRVSEDGRSVYEVDVRGMSDNEIKNVIGSMVSSKYSQQAAINSWQRYSRYSPEGIKRYQSDVDSFLTVKKNEYDANITKLELDVNSVKDKGQDPSTLENQIKNLKLERDSLGGRRASMLQDPEGYGATLEREGIVTNLTTRFKPLLQALPDSFVGKNEVYYAEVENQFDQLKYEIDLQKLELDKEKNKREAEEFRLKASGQWRGGKGDGSDSDGSGSSKYDGNGIGTLPTAPANDRDWEKETIDLIAEKDSTVQTMTKQTFDYVNKMANEGNKGAKALLNDYNLKRKGKHSGAIFRQVYNAQAANLGLNLVEDPNGNQLFTMGDLSAEVEEYNTVATKYKTTKDAALGNVYNTKINGKEFYENIADEDGLMVATPNGLVNLKKLAVQRGVMDSEGNKIKNITDDAMINNTIKANLILGKMTKTGGSSGGMQASFQRVISETDAFELGNIYRENVKGLVKDGRVDVSELKRKAPNTYKALVNYEKVSPSGDGLLASSDSFVGKFLSPNRRIMQDSVFRGLGKESILENKVVKEKYNQALMADLQGFGVDNAIVMSNPKDANYQKFAQQISAFGRPGDNTSKDLLSSLSAEDINEIKYRIKDINGEIKVQFKAKIGEEISTHEVFLNIKDLQRNAPEFMGAMNFQKENFYYSRKGIGNKSVSSSSDGISFVNPNADFIYNSKLQTNLQSEFGGLPFYNAIVSGINKDDTRKFLHSQFKYDSGNTVFYKDILTNSTLNGQQKQEAIKQKQQQFLSIVDGIINNASNYVLDAKFINDNQYALQLKDKSGRSIAGVVQNGDNLKPLKKLFDNYESSAYTMFVTGLIEQEKSNFVEGATDFSSSFKKLTGLQ